MGIDRKPFQGIFNIIRFNWHFYVFAGISLFLITLMSCLLSKPFQNIVLFGVIIAIFPIVISLLISYYIYDLSDLYQLKWLGKLENYSILNINAGFDETSTILKRKYPKCDLTICDFYHPDKHTEISIKRARKIYPPLENTIQISTEKLVFEDNSFDYTLAMLSAHEIRNENERILFFKELNRVTKSKGQIVVTEHLRDLNNFIAYTIGFFHFHSKSSWIHTFKQANLTVTQEIKTTPFITTFILKKNGITF